MSRPSAAPSPSETAVAIAGAGPTGLALGLALAVRGVPCLLLEAEPGPGRESSRATTLHAGTLELLDLVEGLGSRIAARGVAARRSRILRAGRVVLEQDWTRVPSRYAQMLNLPQTEIEDALRTAFEERGGTIRWGAAVSAFAPDAAGVRIAAAGGALRARYLVGCDGARSAVRRGLGLALEGETYPDTFALADAEVKGDFAP
jgi:2-polyprenyl-6-methoxyphenol hydroxylase-like FAD-dependent oxidoreductase